MTDFQDRGDAARRAAGIDGTAGDAQDIPHAFVLDKPTGSCLLCGLGESYRKHVAPAPAPGLTQCPTCGLTPTEPHPRLSGVDRCANCKTHVPACSGTVGLCDVHGAHRHAPAPDGLRDLYAAAIVRGGICVDLAAATDAVLAVRDEELLRLRAETATADQLRADVQRDRDRLREELAEARGQIERVRKAVAERRTELAEYEAEQEPSAWSDAVSVTCSRIEDALRIFPESVGIPCAALPPKDPS